MLANMAVQVSSLCLPTRGHPHLQVGTALRPSRFYFWQQKARPPPSQRLFASSPLFLRSENRLIVAHAENPALGPMDGPENFNLTQLTETVRNLWGNCPEPVKVFPWKKALLNYLHLIFGLAYEVAKYLCVPFLAISSLSEMSYCAHEKKMRFIPLPLLSGAVVAGFLVDSIVAEDLKEGDFPWHLSVTAILFVLLKVFGLYYPYWGRILIPHFANGGLLRVLWSTYIWYRRLRDSSKRVDIVVGNNQFP